MNHKSGIVFWLMRCGATTWDDEGRMRGITDLPLSSSGRSTVIAEASRFADRSIVLVCHPGDEAASESARFIAEKTGAKQREVEDLADPDLGLLEGLSEQMFTERYAKRYKVWHEDPLSLVPPEGEDLIEARGRLFQSVTRQARKAKGEMMFVLHDLALGMLRCWLAHQPTSELWTQVEQRPRVERYAMTAEMLDQLEAVALEAMSSP